MEEPTAEAVPAKRRFRWGHWLAGRAGRREYWLYIGIIIAFSVALSFVPGLGGASGGMTAVLMFAQVRRLHDFGRTGWWAVGATFAPLAVMLPMMVITPIDVAAGAGTLLVVALIILIGAIPGDPGENRFGLPAPFSLKRTLTGR